MSPVASFLIEKYSFRSYLIILSVLNLSMVVAGALMKSPTVKLTGSKEENLNLSQLIESKSLKGRKRYLRIFKFISIVF